MNGGDDGGYGQRDYSAEGEVKQRLDRLERTVDAVSRALLDALARADPDCARVFMEEVGKIMKEYSIPYRSNKR